MTQTPFERLDYLATLEADWMGPGYGDTINKTVLKRAREFFETLGNTLDEVDSPGIFPTEDGNLCVEWSFTGEMWSIDYEEDETPVAAIYDYRDDKDDTNDKEIETDNPQEIVDFFVNHLKEQKKNKKW